LAHAGLPTPATWTTENTDHAKHIVETEVAKGNRVVLKPLFGAQGIGLKLLSSVQDMPEPDAIAGAYYLQRYIPSPNDNWRDWRVLVIGGKAQAAMMRVGTSWITNVRQGASCVAAPAVGELAQLAEKAAEAVGALYAGVDLILDQNGRFTILEVNSMPAWRGLQSVTEFDIAECLVNDLLSRIPSCADRLHGSA
jgi:RimK family alpha-L-glutamate ligase